MTKPKELQQLHWYYCVYSLFCFYHVYIKILKKTNVLIGALQYLPLLLSVFRFTKKGCADLHTHDMNNVK